MLLLLLRQLQRKSYIYIKVAMKRVNITLCLHTYDVRLLHKNDPVLVRTINIIIFHKLQLSYCRSL